MNANDIVLVCLSKIAIPNSSSDFEIIFFLITNRTLSSKFDYYSLSSYK